MATPQKLPPLPNHITQDDDDCANLLTSVLPQLHSVTKPCSINSHALYHILGVQWSRSSCHARDCNKIRKLVNDPLLWEVWTKAMCKELGRLVQGWEQQEGTNTVFFVTKEEIKRILKDRTVTNACIVVDCRPQKRRPKPSQNHCWGQSHQLPRGTYYTNS
eukprot:CCRYP_002705-RA/>CCRYP_002705-RA protein AED:0.62 eAED:0.62 QI:0/0/0/0.5/0/0/2/0/160